MIGNSLKCLRQAHNCTQAKVADWLGVPQSTYATWETDASDPPIPQLIKLADFFCTSVDAICGHYYEDLTGLAEAVSLLSTKQKKTLADAVRILSRGGGVLVHGGDRFCLVLFIYYIVGFCECGHNTPALEPALGATVAAAVYIRVRAYFVRCAYPEAAS